MCSYGFAVVDVETTGLSPQQDRIIEIAILQLDSQLRETAQFHSLINPQIPIQASHIHGLSDADVAQAPTFGDIAEEVCQALDGRRFVAHNARFDREFINAELRRTERGERIEAAHSVCTLDQSRIYCPPGSHSLAGLAQRLGLQVQPTHRAIHDAAVCAELLRLFITRESHDMRFCTEARSHDGSRVLPNQWSSAKPWQY
ncbi:PolC-type DNA polymerase III [Trueperella sp. LYQ141]|uniref:3'-5' exonuclease n=1 Tax=Trueperella sp. LYQ141 TaxID=3391058 RepID=UPI003983D521